MRYIIFLLLACTQPAFSQTDPALDAYLNTHRYTIKQMPDSSTIFPNDSIPRMLDKQLENKRLFVYGDCFSHMLHLNAYLAFMFANYLSVHGLKYYFHESARSWNVEDELFYRSNLPAKNFFKDASQFSLRYYEAERKLFKQGQFTYRGIDFERASGFHKTLQLLLDSVDNNRRAELYKLAPYFRDTSYLQLSRNKFVQFYEAQRDIFLRDSNLFKPLLGNAYACFLYLMNDPKPSTYFDNRNRNMAEHLLMDVGKTAPGEIYFLNLGTAHTRRKKDGLAKTTVYLLNETPLFKDKILVTHLYCENCAAEANSYGTGDNSWLPYMKDDVLSSFRQAAQGTITLFDLSEIPEKYHFIRDDYNDFLVFARGQQ